MRYRQLGFLFLALLLAACGGQLATDGGVSGTWTGQFTQAELPLTLRLTQNGVSVEGELTTGGNTVPLTGTAVNNESSGTTIVSLSGGGANNSVQIEASAAGSAMRGTMVTTVNGTKTNSGFTASR